MYIVCNKAEKAVAVNMNNEMNDPISKKIRVHVKKT